MGAVKVLWPIPHLRLIIGVGLIITGSGTVEADSGCIQTQLVCDSISASGGDAGAISQSVTYDAEAPDCGGPAITVQALTNPFSGPCLVFADFSVDDNVIINGQIYQSPGTDFTFHDTAGDACPDANGAHSDHYCRSMNVGEQITFGVQNNFRGVTFLHATVSFAALPPYPDTFSGTCSAYRDDANCAIGRFRYKFTFPAVTQPFTIHWVERFTPAGGGFTDRHS